MTDRAELEPERTKPSATPGVVPHPRAPPLRRRFALKSFPGTARPQKGRTGQPARRALDRPWEFWGSVPRAIKKRAWPPCHSSLQRPDSRCPEAPGESTAACVCFGTFAWQSPGCPPRPHPTTCKPTRVRERLGQPSGLRGPLWPWRPPRARLAYVSLGLLRTALCFIPLLLGQSSLPAPAWLGEDINLPFFHGMFMAPSL